MKRMTFLLLLNFLGAPKWINRLVLALAITLGLGLSQSWAQQLTGRVVRIADGDTLTVLDASNTQHRVRLKGIDAPESGQAFGSVSKQALSSLIGSGPVTVRVDDKDQYGRILGVVMVNGQDINAEMIRRGMAWHYKRYEADQPITERLLYAKAEWMARANGEGLWRDPAPMAPWDFRRQAR